MKRLEIKDGKFTLEGKVVEAELIALISIKDEYRNDGVKEERVSECAPDKANAYIVGSYTSQETRFIGSKSHYPILYLKIKNGKKSL